MEQLYFIQALALFFLETAESYLLKFLGCLTYVSVESIRKDQKTPDFPRVIWHCLRSDHRKICVCRGKKVPLQKLHTGYDFHDCRRDCLERAMLLVLFLAHS